MIDLDINTALYMPESDGLSSVMRSNSPNTSNLSSIISAVYPLPSHLTKGTEETYTLNFSRPGYQVIAQYFSFIRLGFKGYQAIMSQDLINARLLSNALESTGCSPPFQLSDIRLHLCQYNSPSSQYSHSHVVVK